MQRCLSWRRSTCFDVFVGDSEDGNSGQTAPEGDCEGDQDKDCNVFHHFSIIIVLKRPDESQPCIIIINESRFLPDQLCLKCQLETKGEKNRFEQSKRI